MKNLFCRCFFGFYDFLFVIKGMQNLDNSISGD